MHRSRVLSVQWISHNVLISHNPSAILRSDPLDGENKDTYIVPGEIVVWTWLGLDRFFPPLYDDLRAEGRPQTVLRGCASVSDPRFQKPVTVMLTIHCSIGLSREL
jgi:polycomb protein EED